MSTAPAIEVEIEELAEAINEDFCLGWWRVSPALNRIESRQDGLSRHLEPRLTKLLCYLAANEGKVISREDLVKLLWPRVIVNENSLTRAVSELRKQLIATEDPASSYIETIPKRGYRLLVAVEEASITDLPTVAPTATTLQFPYAKSQQIGIAAFCLTIVSVFGFAQLNLGDSSANFDQPALLADEVVSEASYFGGEVSLSNSDNTTLESETIEAPIINDDKSHFAYIQYDRGGSTIFLGEIAEVMTEPVAIFNSTEKLLNLSWSPLGNALLFAKQSQLTTAELFGTGNSSMELHSINIDTLESFKLVEQTPDVELNENSNGLNLT